MRPIGDEALECVNVQRLVNQVAIAGQFATVIADASTDTGEGVVFFDDAQRVGIAPLADEGDVALGTLAGGAGIAARGNAFFLNCIRGRDRLWVEAIRSAACRESFVKFV